MTPEQMKKSAIFMALKKDKKVQASVARLEKTDD